MLMNRTANSRVFLGIAYGKITRKVQGQENADTYTDIEGHLREVNVRNAEIKGVSTPFIDFIIEDGEDTYDLSVQFNSGVARSIILSLSSVQDFVGNVVRISPYLSKDGEHTNVAVFVNRQKVSWVVEPSKIPALEYVQVGSQKVADDTKRSKFFSDLLAVIQQRLNVAAATPQAAAVSEAGDDLPEGGLHNDDFFAGEGSQHL